MSLKRFGVSLEESLLEGLDHYTESNGFPNRSRALRHLIGDKLRAGSTEPDAPAAGVIIMIYDHHKRSLLERSTTIQHEFESLILAVQHVHLDHDNCLETLILKGQRSRMEELAKSLRNIKGISHIKLETYQHHESADPH